MNLKNWYTVGLLCLLMSHERVVGHNCHVSTLFTSAWLVDQIIALCCYGKKDCRCFFINSLVSVIATTSRILAITNSRRHADLCRIDLTLLKLTFLFNLNWLDPGLNRDYIIVKIKGQNIHWQSKKVVKILCYNVYDLFLCPKSVSNTRRHCFE